MVGEHPRHSREERGGSHERGWKPWERQGAARRRVKGSPSGPSEASREAVPLTRRARRYPEPCLPEEGCLRRRRVVEAADHGMGSTSGSWSACGADTARGPYEHRPARREDPCRRRPADDLDWLRTRDALDGRFALEPTLAPSPVGCRARASTPCRRSIAAQATEASPAATARIANGRSGDRSDVIGPLYVPEQIKLTSNPRADGWPDGFRVCTHTTCPCVLTTALPAVKGVGAPSIDSPARSDCRP